MNNPVFNHTTWVKSSRLSVIRTYGGASEGKFFIQRFPCSRDVFLSDPVIQALRMLSSIELFDEVNIKWLGFSKDRVDNDENPSSIETCNDRFFQSPFRFGEVVLYWFM